MSSISSSYRPLLKWQDAIAFQRDAYGAVAYGRDALFALARAGKLKTVGTQRRVLFVRASLEGLLNGEMKA